VWEFLQETLRHLTSTSQAEPEENIEPFDTDPWAQQLNLQWEKHFEQRDPPTEDKVVQIDVGDQTHLKLISIREIYCRPRSNTLHL